MAARALLDAYARAGYSHPASIPFAQPITFHLWRSGGAIYILLGNLETGLTGDARTERHVTLILNRQHLRLDARDYELYAIDGQVIRSDSCTTAELRFVVQVAPESSAVFTLQPCAEGQPHE
jgi:hypothetical protein